MIAFGTREPKVPKEEEKGEGLNRLLQFKYKKKEKCYVPTGGYRKRGLSKGKWELRTIT